LYYSPQAKPIEKNGYYLTIKKINMEAVIKLKALYFKGVDFSSNADCVMARAAKEQLNATEVNASTTFIYLNNKVFYSAEYTYSQFKEDMQVSKEKGFSDVVVRTVTAKTE